MGSVAVAAAVSIDERGRVAPRWAAKYPPLLALGLAALLALAVLPNSLLVPGAHPGATLEYAPVPPEDADEPPAAANLAGVGLGRSPGPAGVVGAGGGGDDDRGGRESEPASPVGGLPGAVGLGASATNKRCVGNPPRQTEDPLSPPCVAYFSGNNFGATYPGVTPDEVRLLVYLDPQTYANGTDGGLNNVAPSNTLFDLFVPPGEPPNPPGHEIFIVRGLRTWQTYFNDAFQTYGRRVHFFVYWSQTSGHSPESRRADAARLHDQIEPFAVVTSAKNGLEDPFLVEMARRGVLNFGSFSLRPQAFFETFPKLIWSYAPSIEQQADAYASYVCTRVVGRPPVLAAPDLRARAKDTRKLGMIHTRAPNQPGLVRLAELVKERVTACGGEITATGTFAACCWAQDTRDTSTDAQTTIATFRQKNVTTVLWPGGIAGNYGRSAAAVQYFPEWIVSGEGIMDANNPVRLAQLSASFDGRGIVVTPETFHPGLDEQRCAQAYRAVDKQMSRPNLSYLCGFYRDLFQVFVGIQVSGPRLDPTNVDKGFRAIPAKHSDDAQAPACFYLPGDYTCVKDVQAEVWDAGGSPPGDTHRGCWKAIDGGRRHLFGRFPEGNVDGEFSDHRQLECNGYSAPVNVR